jgi:hypothetical protein
VFAHPPALTATHPLSERGHVMAESHSKDNYAARYRKTPRGAAACAWNRLTSRAGGKYNYGRCYAGVEVKMTRDEFIAWAVPAYAAWFRDHPGVTPSLDRIDGARHYEVGNLQLLTRLQNTLKNAKQKNLHAPPGHRWCSGCQGFKPEGEFYTAPSAVRLPTNPNGYLCYCKPCHTSRSVACRRRRKNLLRGGP